MATLVFSSGLALFSLVIQGSGWACLFSLASHLCDFTGLGNSLAGCMPSLALFSLVLFIQVHCWGEGGGACCNNGWIIGYLG